MEDFNSSMLYSSTICLKQLLIYRNEIIINFQECNFKDSATISYLIPVANCDNVHIRIFRKAIVWMKNNHPLKL